MMFQVKKLPQSEIVSIFAVLGDGLTGYCPCFVAPSLSKTEVAII